MSKHLRPQNIYISRTFSLKVCGNISGKVFVGKVVQCKDKEEIVTKGNISGAAFFPATFKADLLDYGR